LTARLLCFAKYPVKVVSPFQLYEEITTDNNNFYVDTYKFLVITNFYDSSYPDNPLKEKRYEVENFLYQFLDNRGSLIIHSFNEVQQCSSWWSKTLLGMIKRKTIYSEFYGK